MARGGRPVKIAAKAAKIAAILDELFPDPPIPLEHQDPFTLLVAVILSAQCTDKKVNEVTPKLFELAKTPQQMTELGAERILQVIRPCGLSPQKSKNIAAMSEILVERYHGQLPPNFVDLESLPGVGHKTASVVMAQAFGHPAFPVDTHIHRLAWRWGLSSGKNVAETERDLKELFPPENWTKLHLQIIYFGRNFCPARGHRPQQCPICCFAMTQRRQDEELARQQK
ncbi:MAG: endonuclease III [Myxococcales bacterium]|nr:endonuclease III [Myxococcales bacterium]